MTTLLLVSPLRLLVSSPSPHISLCLPCFFCQQSQAVCCLKVSVPSSSSLSLPALFGQQASQAVCCLKARSALWFFGFECYFRVTPESQSLPALQHLASHIVSTLYMHTLQHSQSPPWVIQIHCIMNALFHHTYAHLCFSQRWRCQLQQHCHCIAKVVMLQSVNTA